MDIKIKTSDFYAQLRKECPNVKDCKVVVDYMQTVGLCWSDTRNTIRVDEGWKDKVDNMTRKPEVGDIVYVSGRGTHLVLKETTSKENRYFRGYKLQPDHKGSFSLSPCSDATVLELSKTVRVRSGHFDVPKICSLLDRKDKIKKELDEVTEQLLDTEEDIK